MRAILVVLLLCGMAHAQAPERKGEIYEPPRTEAGEAYREAAKKKRIAVDARTLSADAPLTLRPPRRRFDLSSPEGTGRVIAWLVLGGVVVLLLLALARARFGDLFRREDEPAAKPTTRVELADIGSADIRGTRLADLARLDDPREALRLLLAMGLARAADANSIALRRSLTTRDVFARVPATWRSREVLGEIVRRAEPVLFGGRAFTHADLAPLIDRAAPMLDGRR